MPVKAVLFDFMGTCLEYHSTVLSRLPSTIDEKLRSDFVLEWRQKYFDASQARARAGLPYEDIDTTHRYTLSAMLTKEKYSSIKDKVDEAMFDDLIDSWHRQKAWPDVAPILSALSGIFGLDVVVHANGTTRLQMDNARSSGLRYDMLFSSEMLGVYKPAPEAYTRVLQLLQCSPEECVMVAAHAYDTRGAKTAGMRTVYVYRWTDDILEDQEVVRRENDVYLGDGMKGLVEAIKAWS